MCGTGVVRPQQGCDRCGQEGRGHGAAGLAAGGAQLRGRRAAREQTRHRRGSGTVSGEDGAEPRPWGRLEAGAGVSEARERGRWRGQA